ncbi:hypothetical protein [Nocardia nova]|jgi:glyoxylase I family protein|uniref:hypothetical protein n=1 Tax=Nocardia nova TaxID=37330 RepID=UPI0007A4ADBE|nr:hypothetical protein [Nocardia nova]
MSTADETRPDRWRSTLGHFGITVPDLEAWVAFFTELFQARELYRLSPFDAAQLPAAADRFGCTSTHVPGPGAVLKLVMLQMPGGRLFELFQYDNPADSQRVPPHNSDVGGHTLASEVNISSAAQPRRDLGREVMQAPITISEGRTAGTRVQYFALPWKGQLELVEYEPTPPWKEQWVVPG